MATRSTQFARVDSSRGAPMGRNDCIDGQYPPLWEGKSALRTRRLKVKGILFLWQVRMVDGDYDDGGAYWGGGSSVPPLFCLRGRSENGGTQAFFKTKDLYGADALAMAKKLFPNAEIRESKRAWPPARSVQHSNLFEATMRV